MKNLFKNFIVVIFGLFILSALFSLVSQNKAPEELSLTQLVEEMNQEKVKQIIVEENNLKITFSDDKQALARKETEASLSQTLFNYGLAKEKLENVEIIVKSENNAILIIGQVLSIAVPILMLVFFFWIISKQTKMGATQAFDFTKAKAKLFGAEGHSEEKITFKDVAGLKEAKEELKEVVDFLKNPKKFLAMGAKIPRGVLLLGPSGVGKTLLARAVAGESNVPFFHASGSSFVELFVGVGSARIRDLFALAKKNVPSIVFIDELDAIGKSRGTGIGGSHDEREQTLNQLLVEMDGFERNTNVIVIGATNRNDVLDSALLRPGRFDRRVVLDLPDINDREEILKIHCIGKPLVPNANLREVAERTPGFSGADIANIANEAAILAARKNRTQVFQEDLLESIEKVLLGPERKSHILSKREKEITAFHEVGHALVSAFSPGAEPIRKISIIARGMAAGYTLKVPSEDKKIRSKTEFLSEIAICLGGYCAEKIKFGEITTGASNDLEKASLLARKLVKEYGMSSLGPVSFNENNASFLEGGSLQNPYSEQTAVIIDKEVSKFIEQARKTAEKIIRQQKKLMEKIARVLIDKEIIERETFEELIGLNKAPKKKKAASLKVKVRTV
ncbi:ATP-dependent zinc metalloprotease FtsH [Candidatus Parcubacteria bacterium]|nr:ATP-dependent zinc metalloprotease FtsH [Patescibacteria group bacterium]MCG2688220.1 ATP-dependent zinc metalloprotease FtsH [Candidatus Parcubacteria bacterium]